MSVATSNIYGNAVGFSGDGSGSLTLTGNAFSNNRSQVGDVYLDSGLAFNHSGNTASGTGKLGYSTSGTLGANETLTASDLPYVIDGITVPSGKTLTVNSGAVLKFDLGAYNIIVQNGGILNVQGTSASPAYFTSLNDQAADGQNTDNTSTAPLAGDWDAINLNAGASSTIDYAVVRYGGNSFGHDADIYNAGGTLAVASSTVATSTTYGIYQTSGTMNIINSNLHNTGTAGIWLTGGTLTVGSSQFAHDGDAFFIDGGSATVVSSTLSNENMGAYIDGGTLTVVSSAIHDDTQDGIYMNNSAILTVSSTLIATSTTDGIYQGNGTSTIFASDIRNNYDGVDFEAGSINLSGNAIHANTSYGLLNGSGSNITADNNWWGASVGPGAKEPEEGNYSDATSTTNITVNTIHNLNGFWAARNNGLNNVLLYNSTSTSYPDLLTQAIADWNNSATGMGIVTVSSTSASTTGVLRIYSYYDDSDKPDLCGKTSDYYTASNTLDTIFFNTYCMDHEVGTGRLTQFTPTSTRLALIRHELGHALGLGHNWRVTGNVMWPYWDDGNMAFAFGPDDKSDYNFLWNTFNWATPVWWPSLLPKLNP